MNNLQALEQLEKSAQEQEKRLSSTIQGIHKESLQDLNHSLENIHKTSMKSFNKSITELHKESLQEIMQFSKKDRRLIISLTAILGIIIGVISTIMIKPYLIPSESQEVQIVEVSTGISQEQYNKAIKDYNSWKNKAESQEKEIEQLQRYNQELQVWQVPNGYQMNAKQGKFIAVPKEKIYTEQENKIYIRIGD